MFRRHFSSQRSAASARALIAYTIFAAACGGDSDHHSEEEGTASGAECPPNSTLTYDTFGESFMEEYCVRCHSSDLEATARNGAPEGHDFDVYEGIIPVAEHIDQKAGSGPDATNTEMPPTDPKPSMGEREMLAEWLACELEIAEQ